MIEVERQASATTIVAMISSWRGVAQPDERGVDDPEVLQDAVQPALLGEDRVPDDARREVADPQRQHVDVEPEPRPAQFRVHQQRHGQGEHELHRQDDRQHDQRVPHRRPEAGVVEQLVHRREAPLPALAGKRQPQALQQRHDEEHHEVHDGRCQQDVRRPGPGGGAGRPPAGPARRRQARSRSAVSSRTGRSTPLLSQPGRPPCSPGPASSRRPRLAAGPTGAWWPPRRASTGSTRRPARSR